MSACSEQCGDAWAASPDTKKIDKAYILLFCQKQWKMENNISRKTGKQENADIANEWVNICIMHVDICLSCKQKVAVKRFQFAAQTFNLNNCAVVNVKPLAVLWTCDFTHLVLVVTPAAARTFVIITFGCNNVTQQPKNQSQVTLGLCLLPGLCSLCRPPSLLVSVCLKGVAPHPAGSWRSPHLCLQLQW